MKKHGDETKSGLRDRPAKEVIADEKTQPLQGSGVEARISSAIRFRAYDPVEGLPEAIIEMKNAGCQDDA